MDIIKLYFQQNQDCQQKSVHYAMFSASSQLSRDGDVGNLTSANDSLSKVLIFMNI